MEGIALIFGFCLIVSLLLYAITEKYWITSIGTSLALILFFTFLLGGHIDNYLNSEYYWVVVKYGAIGFVVSSIYVFFLKKIMKSNK